MKKHEEARQQELAVKETEFRALQAQAETILDTIGDKGLEVVASTCKDLQELVVFPCDMYGARGTLSSRGKDCYSKLVKRSWWMLRTL
ncbi:hypothetical protein ACS0TY_004789 [Phlomoides rotata]